jgi:hypothetical protein
MAEPVAELSELSEPVGSSDLPTPETKTGEAEPTPSPEPPPEPTKKGRGRPAGSKDQQKRQVKRVAIQVEPIQAPSRASTAPSRGSMDPSRGSTDPPEPDPAVAEPVSGAKTAPVPPEPEPPSPRTLLKMTSRHLIELRGLVNQGRRVETASRYTQKLSSWPVV